MADDDADEMVNNDDEEDEGKSMKSTMRFTVAWDWARLALAVPFLFAFALAEMSRFFLCFCCFCFCDGFAIGFSCFRWLVGWAEGCEWKGIAAVRSGILARLGRL